MASATNATPGNTMVVSGAPATENSKPSATPPVSGNPPFPNLLHDFSSYNCVFTLSAMSSEYASTGLYRTGVKHIPNEVEIICRSGSGFPENRPETIAGKFDFFLDDLRILSATGMDTFSKNTNATGLSFSITEPYSMGLFYQSLKVASLKCGHKNYLICPYLLTIEFFGHVGPEKLNQKIESLTKYISVRLSKIGMNTTAAGSVYTVEAYPWNEQAYSTLYTELKTDVTVRGKRVIDLCSGTPDDTKNLQSVINTVLKEKAERNKDPQPDAIVITFPPTADETSGINEIGEATMDFNTIRTAPPGAGKEDQVYNPKTGSFFKNKLTINDRVGEIKFGQGADLIDAINQIILLSDYGRKALENIDENGMVKAWRIETQFFSNPISEQQRRDGTSPSIVLYKVIPYKVHISKFSTANTALKGKQNLEKQALKEFNYIYTGKNVDVLDFNIVVDPKVFAAINFDSGLKSGDTKTGAQGSISAADNKKPTVAGTEVADAGKTESPSRVERTSTGGSISGGLDTFASVASKQFFDAITSMGNMIELDMTILGDPYFLGDSGLGNYFAKETSLFNMNSDGAINWHNGEVDVKVNFRTPVDPDLKTGLYEFPKGPAESKVIEEFSGLFKVNQIESIFQKNKFTQVLKLVRRLHQYSENQEGKSEIPPEVASAKPSPDKS